MRSPDWSVSVRQRRAACVLDPALLLCHGAGPTLALGLTRLVEPWLTRSFWQLIDASELLLAAPAPAGARPAPVGAQWLRPSAQALRDWLALRESTDAGSWPLRWVGDCLAESQVQGDAGLDVVSHYEQLSESLLRRCALDGTHHWGAGFDALAAALDAVALSATLDGAMLLGSAGGARPWTALVLEQAGIAVLPLEPLPAESLFAAERQWLRESLASAGLAACAETLPPLVVLHVLLDAHDEAPADETAGEVGIDTEGDPWTNARAWWYRV